MSDLERVYHYCKLSKEDTSIDLSNLSIDYIKSIHVCVPFAGSHPYTEEIFSAASDVIILKDKNNKDIAIAADLDYNNPKYYNIIDTSKITSDKNANNWLSTHGAYIYQNNADSSLEYDKSSTSYWNNPYWISVQNDNNSQQLYYTNNTGSSNVIIEMNTVKSNNPTTSNISVMSNKTYNISINDLNRDDYIVNENEMTIVSNIDVSNVPVGTIMDIVYIPKSDTFTSS